MVGPNFRPPETALSKKWLETDNQRLINKTGDYRNWWKTFNDPVLGNLIEQAYKENLSLRIAGVRVLEARAQLGIASGELYPQSQIIAGSLQYVGISKNSFSSIPVKKYSQAEFTGSAIWELDFWGKFRRQIQSANASWLASIADYDNALVSLTGDIANSYINIRTIEKRLQIANQNAITQKETLKITQTRFHDGIATKLDLEQATTILDDTLSSVPVFEAQLQQNKNALCVLLGITADNLADFLKAQGDIPPAPAQILIGIPADLLRRRPDIRSAEYQAIAQCAQIGVAKSEIYPALSLNGTFGFSASDIGPAKLSDIFQKKSRMYQAGPSFEWNILNYGQITNNIRVQDARFQELLINYQNKVLAAQQEVEDNLISFIKTQEEARLLAESVTAAKDAFELAAKQYREGTRDFTAVLVAEDSLLNQQDSLAIALGDIAHSVVGIYRALGGGWETYEQKEMIPADIAKEMAKRTNWGRLLKPVSYNAHIAPNPESTSRFSDW